MNDWQNNAQAFVQTAADETFGLSREQSSAGRRSFLRPTSNTHGLDGRPVPGVLFLLADSILGGACIQAIGPHEVIVTSSMHIDFRTVPFATLATVSGEAPMATRFSGTAVAAGSISADGVIVATIGGRFPVLALGSRTGGPIASAVELPGEGAPMTSARDYDCAVHETLEAEFGRSDESSLEMSVVASPRLANERAGIHGGAGALIGERACDALLRRVATGRYETTELRATFLRPLAADGARIGCVARMDHLGRKLAVARATVFTATGAPALLVDVISAGSDTS